MIRSYAVKCDRCHWGYINGEVCHKCQGNGSILIEDDLEPLKTWEAALLIGIALIGAFLVVYGAYSLVVGLRR